MPRPSAAWHSCPILGTGTHCTLVRAGCCCCCEPRPARPRRCCSLPPPQDRNQFLPSAVQRPLLPPSSSPLSLSSLRLLPHGGGIAWFFMQGAGPFLSCHGLPWGRISLGSRYSCRLERQRVRGPGGSWLAWGLCVSPIAARRAGSGFPFLSCASGRARGAVCVVHGMAGGSSIWGLAGGAEGSELSIARGRGWHINLRVSCKGGASLQ